MKNNHYIIQKVGQTCVSALMVGPKLLMWSEHVNAGEHIGSPLRGDSNGKYNNAGHIIQWFKTMTTNEYIRDVKQNSWAPFRGKLWQRNYYEHIIRDEQSHLKIAEYIINNPLDWPQDDYYEK